MNGVLPKEFIRFCHSNTKKRRKHSKLKDKTDCVKQESTDDFKDYAETTMNELLGWYGYEKLDTRDTQALNLQHFKSNNDPQSSLVTSSPSATHPSRGSSTSSKSKDIIISADESHSALSPNSGSDGGGIGGDSTGNCRFPSPLTTETNTENGNENKDSAEDNQNIPPGCIVCAWCAKVGMKLFTLRTANGCKAFCSELCFTQCRRASFKKNKICDWCKHVRHTVNYVDFQDGEQQLQFCSNKCLNQYKMNIFCNETKAHLQLHPHLKESSKVTTSKGTNLITPDLWLREFKNGENESSSLKSFKDSSDDDSDADIEDSQTIVPHSLKRKFLEFSGEQNDNNSSKESTLSKDSSKEKTTKEKKRVKHSNSKMSHNNRHSGTKHSNSSNSGQNEWSSRETKDMNSNFHSPPFVSHSKHSPTPPSVPSIRGPIVAPNHNIPLLNGTNAVTFGLRSGALNGIAPNGSPAGHLFPRLPGSIGRAEHHIRPPLMPSPAFGPRAGPIPNLLGPAHMEMLMRMQSGFAGLRHPMPYPPHAPTGHPITNLPNNLHLNGSHQTSGPLLQPSQQQSGSMPTPMFPNSPLMPPITVIVPHPIFIPLPIPIPIPLLFPIDNNLKTQNNNQTKFNNKNDVTTTSTNNENGLSNTANTTLTSNTSKVESVISKLVERKTKAANDLINQNINHSNVDTLDLSRKNAIFKNEDNSNTNESVSDHNRETTFPQNLVISRNKRCIGLSITPSLNSGYRVQ